jgi:hypothetical protein
MRRHEATLDLAREAAGDLDVRIGGGPTVVRDFLVAKPHRPPITDPLDRPAPLFDGVVAASLTPVASPSISIVKRVQPLADHLTQARAVDAVDAFPTFFLDTYEAGSLETPQMSRRGRPAAGKTIRDLARRHAAAAVVQDEKDVAPRRVRQRAEHRIEVRQLAASGRVASRLMLLHCLPAMSSIGS